MRGSAYAAWLIGLFALIIGVILAISGWVSLPAPWITPVMVVGGFLLIGLIAWIERPHAK